MMKNFSSFKLKTQIFLGCLSPVLCFLFLSGITYSSYIKRVAEQERVEAANANILKLNQTVSSVSDMVRSARGQALFPDETALQKSFEQDVQLFQAVSLKLSSALTSSQYQEEINIILTEGNSFIEAGRRVFGLLNAGQIAQARAIAKTMQLVKIEASHMALLNEATQMLQEAEQAEQAADQFLVLTIIVDAVLCTLFTIIISSLITAWISRTLNQAASEITSSFSEIATTVDQHERIANEQAASVNQTTTTMDELEASCRQSALQAQSAVTAAQQALQSAKNGTQTVGATLKGISTMKVKVEAIAEQIVCLSEQASQIGSISQLVSDLANQTSMLAINSSVEAVRAGEHGKGFVVIASEIRKLSDQSHQSTEKISTLVSEIQKAINSTVMATDEGTKTMKMGVEIAQKTERAFTEVTSAVTKVVINNQQVSLNLKQQVDAIQQVVEAMESINQGAKETAIGLTQTKIGTHQLNKAALLLQEIV
jgi:methyl-accepting chemotaxis protein